MSETLRLLLPPDVVAAIQDADATQRAEVENNA